MRILAVLISPLLLLACSGTTPASSGPTPAPSQARPAPSSSPTSAPVPALAVLVDFPNGTGPQSTGYDLALVAADGHVAARAHAAARTNIDSVGGPGGAASIDLPEVSVANGRVYYLDGDQTVRYLSPDGATGTFATVPGSTTAHAAFAVSPDATRIAVGVLTYQGNAATVTSLYVHNVASGNQQDVSHPSSELAWPVAWHGTDLVLGVSAGAFTQQGLVLNPYAAAAYHVVDPATSSRVASIGGPDFVSACEVTGLLVTPGTACVHQTASQASELWLLSWSGARIDTIAFPRQSATAALGPDQSAVAICCDGTKAVVVARGRGSQTATALKGSFDSWPCWIDGQHVLAGSVNDHQFQPSVIDLSSGRVAPADAHGFCAAVLGSGGGSGAPF
jgi:hypothetical protein